jgi:hypothetical protein
LLGTRSEHWGDSRLRHWASVASFLIDSNAMGKSSQLTSFARSTCASCKAEIPLRLLLPSAQSMPSQDFTRMQTVHYSR